MTLAFSGPFAPFTFALGLLAGLLVLEIILALMGGSILGAGADGDLDLDLDIDADLPDLDGFDLGDLDPGDYELPALEADAAGPGPGDGASALSWMGLGNTPFMIWLASILLGFGVSGYLVQSAVMTSFAPLPGWIAAVPAGLLGLGFAGRFGRFFARVLPKTESSSLSEARLSRRMGIVSQGTARHGSPAEVKVIDHTGNTYYLRAEPAPSEADIPEGASVLVLRNRRSGQFHLVRTDA